MSGLNEIGALYGFAQAGQQVAPRDIDQYVDRFIFAPSVDFSYLGTCTSATANAPVVTKNNLLDWPRNLAYSVTGVAGGMGGTFQARGRDQFGGTVTENVTIGSAAGGGTAYGTAIFASYGTGTFSPAGLGGTAVGTVSIGVGTASGTAGNYFGLKTKIGSTADVKNIVWITTNTPTTLAGGTAIGTLVSVTNHAFQGTSGVAATDRYLVTIKPTFDNGGKQNLAGL